MMLRKIKLHYKKYYDKIVNKKNWLQVYHNKNTQNKSYINRIVSQRFTKK